MGKTPLDSVVHELNNVCQRLERLYDALETGSLTLDDLDPCIQTLRQTQELLMGKRIELESRLSDTRVELADLNTVTSFVKELGSLIEYSSISERKALIRSFVKGVVVKGSEVTVEYTPDFLVGMNQKETLKVPAIVQHGGPWLTVPELLFEKNELITVADNIFLNQG